MFDRFVVVVVYYLGGLLVCIGVAIGNGLNGTSLAYSLFAPLGLFACLAMINGPEVEVPLPPMRAAVWIGSAALVLSILAHLFGPAHVRG